MKLLAIRANNMLAFENVDIDFRNAGSVIGVRAIYSSDAGRSNRAGKSALVYDLPLFALAGYSRTGTSADVVRRGCASGWVEVEVEARGTEFVVRRTQTGRTSSVEISGSEGLSVRDSNEKIENLLGLPVDDLRKVSLFEQGDVLGFLGGDQRRILARWLEQSHWEAAHVEAGKRVRESNAAYIRAKDLLDLTEQAKESLEQLRMNASYAETAAGESESAVAALHEKSLCTREREAVSEAEALLADRRSEHKLLISKQKLEEIEQLADLSSQVDELKSEVSTTDRAIDMSERAVRSADRNLKSAVTNNDNCHRHAEDCKRAARDAMANKDATATPCHLVEDSPCAPLVEARRTERKKLVAKVLEDARRSAENAAESSETLRECDSTYEQAQEILGASTLRKQALSVDLLDLQEEVRQKRSSLLARFASDMELVKVEIEECVEALAWRRDELVKAVEDAGQSGMFQLKAEARDLRLAAVRTQTEYETALTRVEMHDEVVADEAIKARRARALRILRSAFGEGGIPARIVEGYLDDLATDANEFLERLGAEPRIEWRTWRHLQKWQSECRFCGCADRAGRGETATCQECGAGWERARKEDFACVLKYGTRDAELASDSGGGKTLIALAVRFALSRLIARARGAEADLLVLDEPFAALDVVNRRAAIDLVTGVLSTYGVRQVFLISHVSDVQDSVGDIMTIVRDNDVSSVQVSWQ